MGLLGVPAMFQVVYHPPAGLSGQVFWVVVEVQVAQAETHMVFSALASEWYTVSAINILLVKTNYRPKQI